MTNHPITLAANTSEVWNALLQPGVLFVLALGVGLILVARVIRLQFWLWRLKHLVLAGLLLLALQVLLYFTVFDRCETLSEAEDGTTVLLAGVIESVRSSARRPEETVFTLADPTGRVSVITTNGPPAAGSLCLVKGRTASAHRLPLVICEFRLSTLGHQVIGSQ